MKVDSRGEIKWRNILGTPSDEEAHSLAIDSSGNIYVTGYTLGGLDGNTNYGKSDLFIVKYNNNGVKQWTQQLGSPSHDKGFDISIDSSDQIYVTGYTEGEFDGKSNSGRSDIILVKYNVDGVRMWTQMIGTHLDDIGYSVTVDSLDNVYVTGSTYGEFYGEKNKGGRDIVLVIFDSDGVKKWSKQIGTSSNDNVLQVIADKSDNIYLTGLTEGGFDNNNNFEVNCIYKPCTDIFLMKFSSKDTK